MLKSDLKVEKITINEKNKIYYYLSKSIVKIFQRNMYIISAYKETIIQCHDF